MNGIASLPQAPAQAPMGAPAQPPADPGADMQQLQAISQSVTPEDFGQGTLESLQEQDPQLLAEIQQELADLEMSPEELATVIQMVDMMLQSPEQYPEFRQELISMGLEDDVLPEQYDPRAVTALRAVLSMIPAPQVQMGSEEVSPMEPQGFANGGPVSMKPIAKFLAQQGRNGDTMLAHITPSEAALLKSRGGSGTINPVTGMPEFFLKKVGKALKKVGQAVKKFAKTSVGKAVIAIGATILTAGAAAPIFGTGYLTAGIAGAVGGATASLAAGEKGKDIWKSALKGSILAMGAQAIMPGSLYGSNYREMDQLYQYGQKGGELGFRMQSPTQALSRIGDVVSTAGSRAAEALGFGSPATIPASAPITTAGGAGYTSTLVPGAASITSAPTLAQAAAPAVAKVAAPAVVQTAASGLPSYVVPAILGATAMGLATGQFDTENPKPEELGMAGLPGGETGFDYFEKNPERYGVNIGGVESAYAPDVEQGGESTPFRTVGLGPYDPFTFAEIPQIEAPQIASLNFESGTPRTMEELLALYEQPSGGIATFAKGGYVYSGGMTAAQRQAAQRGQTLPQSLSPAALLQQQRDAERAADARRLANSLPASARADAQKSVQSGQTGYLTTSQIAAQQAQALRNQEAEKERARIAREQQAAAAAAAAAEAARQREIERVRGLVSSGRMSLAEIPKGHPASADARANPEAYMTAQERIIRMNAEKEKARIQAEIDKIYAANEQKKIADALAAREAAARTQANQGIASLNAQLQGLQPKPAPAPTYSAPVPLAPAPSQTLPVGGSQTPAQIPASGAPEGIASLPPATPPPTTIPVTNVPQSPTFALPGTTEASSPFSVTPYLDPMAQLQEMQGTGSTPVAFAQGGIAAIAPSKFNSGGSRYYPRKVGPINGPGTGTSDSIPAMLSDGEFVFTAKAVRNMGGGSRIEGAKKMYKMMKALERGNR